MLDMLSCKGERVNLNGPIVFRQDITSFYLFSKPRYALPHQNVALKVIHAKCRVKIVVKSCLV